MTYKQTLKRCALSEFNLDDFFSIKTEIQNDKGKDNSPSPSITIKNQFTKGADSKVT